MPKAQTIFSCTNCDAQFAKWIGRCLTCGAWGTIAEAAETHNSYHPSTSSGQAVTRNPTPVAPPLETQVLSNVQGQEARRLSTKILELDRVLGGGLVPGSFILVGGEPGIGKSTLALQLAMTVPNVLYISGEESVEQIKLRADRLRVTSYELRDLKLANATNIDSVIATIQKDKPALAIIDSIQTMYSEEVPGEPGNPTQVRAGGAKLMECAKTGGTTIVLIGHVTKDGTLAGPKTLEHIVDTVLYFEGDQHHNLRLLRAVKNRFGSTDEVGVFEMTEAGLKEVANPSQLLLQERGENVPGSVVTCLLEGTRPMLVEVQALVTKTVFGYPVRKASGFDLNRLHVLIAVLQQRTGLALGQYDVHVNVVGGIKVNEPAADLAVTLAIASAYKDKALGKDLAVFGEVGLGGEVRSVRQSEKRIKECEQLGMKRVVTDCRLQIADCKLTLTQVKNIQELVTRT